MKDPYLNKTRIKDVIRDFIGEHRLQPGFDDLEVKAAWKELMGKGVNSYTSDLFYENQTLYVSLSSSVLREELSYGRQKIIKILNESLGRAVLKELVLR